MTGDSVDDGGFRYGMVVKNSLVQHYVVMALCFEHMWEHPPSGKRTPMWRAVVLEGVSRGPVGPYSFGERVGSIVTISGRVGLAMGDWWVVES